MMTDADHRAAAAAYLSEAAQTLPHARRRDRPAVIATLGVGHALLAGHPATLPEPDHHDVYAEDQPDPHRRIEAERDQLAAQVRELNTRLDDVIGRTQCDRAALTRTRRVVDEWAGDSRAPTDMIVALREALAQRPADRAEASRG